jgi:lipoprotein-anchoring transpeptidase ErfK/SrfK
MHIQKPTLISARFLTAASAMFWLGTAAAAPLAPSYSSNSGALFASVMNAPDPTAEPDSNVALARDLQRQVVNYATPMAAGTIVIDTAQTYLFYVLGGGKAIRYGIGVGRDGFTWSGSQAVTRMAEWPDWAPPQDMIARQPYLPRWMAGGKGNPLGARAIYLGSTVYRIHGTNAPATIGTRVSSGCFRMINADVIDLYNRIRVGTKIVVLSNHSQAVRKAPAPAAASPAPAVASLRATGIY